MSVIGVPIKVDQKISISSFLKPNQLRSKVLHEAEGHIVTIETTSGEVFVTLLLMIYIIHYLVINEILSRSIVASLSRRRTT